MRAKTFNYSLLALGVAAVLGMSTTANAAPGDPAGTTGTNTSVEITNQASANYQVANQTQPKVLSNTVKITVSEQVAFTLSADNDDTASPTNGAQGDDKNQDEEVAPNGFAVFEHTLTNTGNRTDTYTMSLAANDPKYDTANSTVSFKVYSSDGQTIIRQGDLTFAQVNGIETVLEKGQYVKFIINAKTMNNQGGDKPSLTISAKSKALTENAASVNSLTNADNAFTRLPTFGIVKTITNGLDLNDPTDTATYKVVVTNQSTTFSTSATEVDIADFLPPGLVLATPLTATNIIASSTATVGTIAAGATGDSGFNVTGNTIPVGQNITITFTVIKGGSGTLDPENAINHVTVTDDLDNDTATDNTLVDSTDTAREANVGEFYPTRDTNYIDGAERTLQTGDDSTGPLSIGGTIRRALTLTGPTFREIAPTSGTDGQVTHATVITNTGKDVEGSNAGELTFTITDFDGTLTDQVNIEPGSVTITYDPDGAGAGAAGSAIPIGFTTVGGVNVYDINSALPGGIAPNGTVTINYNVSSVGAQIFTPSNSTTPTDEKTVVTLIPGKEGAPVPTTVTDLTTVRGLVLLKTQAIDKTCSGTATTFVSTPLIDALPGECIIYKVQAQNTFSADATSPTGVGFDITNVVISDAFSNFSNQADYVANSVTATNGTAAANTDDVTTTIATLAPQETATMQFSVKIKTARVIPQP